MSILPTQQLLVWSQNCKLHPINVFRQSFCNLLLREVLASDLDAGWIYHITNHEYLPPDINFPNLCHQQFREKLSLTYYWINETGDTMRRPAQGVFRFAQRHWRWKRSDSLREMCDVTKFPRTKVHHRSWKWELKLVDGMHESYRTGIIQIANEGFNNKHTINKN